MAATTQSIGANESVNVRAEYSQGGLRFDRAFTLLSMLFLAGLWIDGWAHFHGRVDDSFFTPWHLVFYSAFGLCAAFLIINLFLNVRKGFSFTRALPKGYWLSLIGVTIFALGGVGDMIWHTLFGIEDGTEALLSPTHIMLAIGMALVFTGPVRAAWNRAQSTDASGQRGWGALAPMIICITLVLSLIWFFTSYANPIALPLAARGAFRGPSDTLQDFGVTGILMTMAIMSSIIVLLAWRWKLPFGAFTLLLTASTALLTVLIDSYWFIPGALITGVITDIFYARFKPSPERLGALALFAFITPALYMAAYFITVQVIAGVIWSIHVWTGAIFLSGIIGLLALFVVNGALHLKPNE